MAQTHYRGLQRSNSVKTCIILGLLLLLLFSLFLFMLLWLYLESGTFGIPGLVLLGRGTAWHKSGTSREIRDGWQPYVMRSHLQSVRQNVNRNAGLICKHILSTRTMCFSRWVKLLLIVIAAGVLISAETRKPIYHIRRYCNATSEYSPICSISLILQFSAIYFGEDLWGTLSLCWVSSVVKNHCPSTFSKCHNLSFNS